MKKIIRNFDDIYAMSKIVDKYAIEPVSKDIGKFIYFSESNTSHGPRIKFYGGTIYTSSTRKSPTLKYTKSGNCSVELASWMNKDNCPNAFDNTYIQKLSNFVANYKSILLLVWFKRLDEGDALAYFHGQIPFSELISDIEYDIPDTVKSTKQLDEFCLENKLYCFKKAEKLKQDNQKQTKNK